PGWDGPQSGLVCEIPDLVADGSSSRVPASGRAIVGRPVARPGLHPLERVSDVGDADLEALGGLVGGLIWMVSEPAGDPLFQRREVLPVEVEPHAAEVGVPADAVTDWLRGLGFAVLGLEANDRGLAVTGPGQPGFPD